MCKGCVIIGKKIQDIREKYCEGLGFFFVYFSVLDIQYLFEILFEQEYKVCVVSLELSDKAYMLFAKPMIKASLAMVQSVAGERRDIPHMRRENISQHTWRMPE